MALFWIFLLFLFGMSAALPQDMSGKMLVFSQETDTDHVRLTSSQNLKAATVCLRFFTDLTRDFIVFSLASRFSPNAFAFFHRSGNSFEVWVNHHATQYKVQEFQINRWQSVCLTWEAATGLAQLWLDGKPYTMKFMSNAGISGQLTIVLGQDQDSIGGGFNIEESFVGMMTDVHMWDYVLSPHNIDNYSQRFNFSAGNILDWRSLEFQITGRVFVQNEQHAS